MKRLTYREDDGKAFSNFLRTAVVDKLADYEDAEENGLLIHLPCRVGDTVYEVQEVRKRIQPQEIISVNFYRTGEINFGWELKDGKGMYVKLNGFNERDIGKTVFLTSEEAENELERLKNNG